VIKGIRASVDQLPGVSAPQEGSKPEGGAPLKEAVLDSLANDPGLHQLLPYLSQFFADEVTHNLRNLPLLGSLLRMVWALLQNEANMFVEPYLHQWMPALLTCLVGKRLCTYASEDHWSLRDFAAKIIARICARYGTAYSSMQPRILRTLIHAFLDPLKPLTTHYGAVVGMSALGAAVVEMLLLPNLLFYVRTLQTPESRKGPGDGDASSPLEDVPTIPLLEPHQAKELAAGKKSWKDMSEEERKEWLDQATQEEAQKVLAQHDAVLAGEEGAAMRDTDKAEFERHFQQAGKVCKHEWQPGSSEMRDQKVPAAPSENGENGDPSSHIIIDKAKTVRRMETGKVMEALKAAAGMVLRLRPTALDQKTNEEGKDMPSYNELVEVFGEGLLPHTMLISKSELVHTTSRAKAPEAYKNKPCCKRRKINPVVTAGSIGNLFL